VAEWDDYQEETAEFFRSIGLEAETNVTLQGVRTSHDVDVVVRSDLFGFDLLWIIECKYWRQAVSKLHVLALREIVADLGADRGILVSESGFQSGAIEAADLTNVQLSNLAQLRVSSANALGMARLREVHDRVLRTRARYWDLDKDTRIERGLRPDVAANGYSGDRVMNAIEKALSSAFAQRFPVESADPAGWGAITTVDPEIFAARSASELADRLEPLIDDLENRLDSAYEAIKRDQKASRSQ
jgi:restriction system protein